MLPSYLVLKSFVKFSEVSTFFVKSAKFKDKSGELIALNANKRINKTHFLTIKAKLFNLHVTSQLYITSKNVQKLHIFKNKKKIISLTSAFFCGKKEKVRIYIHFRAYSDGAGGCSLLQQEFYNSVEAVELLISNFCVNCKNVLD